MLATKYINRRSSENLFHARRFAEESGISMNYMVSINWELLDVTPMESTAMFKELKKRVCRSWRYRMKCDAYRYGPFYYVEVQENPDGKPNTHWVMHLDDFQAKWIKEKIESCLEKIRNLKVPANSVHILQVYKSGGLFKYINKGVNPAYADYLHLDHVDQGMVFGQRTNTSRNIGKTARANAKWKRKKQRKRTIFE